VFKSNHQNEQFIKAIRQIADALRPQVTMIESKTANRREDLAFWKDCVLALLRDGRTPEHAMKHADALLSGLVERRDCAE
jgi:hypothetical protein